MNSSNVIKLIFFSIFFNFGALQAVSADDFSNKIKVADNKFLVEQYDEAKTIYQNIIQSSDVPAVVAYAHYKLGTLYKRQNRPEKAKLEYKAGLLSLKEAGEPNHQIAKYLTRALQTGG
jgi:hypothetical protein